MDFFDIISPDGHAIEVWSLPNKQGNGPIHHEYVSNETELKTFLARYDHPGRALYHTVAKLRDGMSRSQEAVESVYWIWGEIDFKDHSLSPEAIRRRIDAIPIKPTLTVFSGHGFHLYWKLNEPENAAPGEGQRVVEEALALACNYIGGDSSVAETARLMRLPGSHNTRNKNENILVTVAAHNNVSYELSDLVDFWLEAQPILPAPSKPAPATPSGDTDSEPVDVEARYAAMRFGGHDKIGINATQCACTASRLCWGTPFDDVVAEALQATKDAVRNDPKAANWDWIEEKLTIEKRCAEWINKHPELYETLPDGLRTNWEERLSRGRNPKLVYDKRTGWGVRSRANDEDSKEFPKEESPQAGYRFRIVPFDDMRPGAEPLYLIDELIPVRGLVDFWGKPKCFKSFVILDMMLHVSMGWEYHDRYVRQGAVVYCAFEGAHGYKKRVEALRRHYRIGDTKAPLYIMPGQANLIKDHKLLISDLSAQLGEVTPVAVVLDTLNKSLIGSESKDIDMSAYLRAAEAVRDAFGCVVVIVHHCGLDETRPRGHTSLPGAVDAQIAVVREGNTVTATVEMMRDGAEDTSVTCVAEVIEVGTDANGKVLTSLVMTPGERVPSGPKRKWSKALSLFRRALNEALIDSKQTVSINGSSIRAADVEAVRTEFYGIYVPRGDTEEQRQDSRKHAFHRAVDRAQKDGLVGVRVSERQTLIWLATPDTISPQYNLSQEEHAYRDK